MKENFGIKHVKFFYKYVTMTPWRHDVILAFILVLIYCRAFEKQVLHVPNKFVTDCLWKKVYLKERFADGKESFFKDKTGATHFHKALS